MVKLSYDDNPAVKHAIEWLHQERDVGTVGDTVNAFKSEFNGYLFVDVNWDWEEAMFANDQDAVVFLMRFS